MEEIVEEVTELYKQGDWKTIVKKFRTHPNRNKVLWVFPTEENFKFIGSCMVKLNCEAIVSVGCGSGLLEWMITEATGEFGSNINKRIPLLRMSSTISFGVFKFTHILP